MFAYVCLSNYWKAIRATKTSDYSWRGGVREQGGEGRGEYEVSQSMPYYSAFIL